MIKQTPDSIQAAITYIEDHLDQKLTLESIAAAVHYSPYHLHRSFAAATALTLHSYAGRRQLTEAARLLVFSNTPILEIALLCGYTSQQAFSASFKTMYKLPPAAYRQRQTYYPLQLPIALQPQAALQTFCQKDIRLAETADIPAWLTLVRLAVDGYPYLNEADYLQELAVCIHQKRALILTDDTLAAGAMIFSPNAGSIDFFGVHPQYRRAGLPKLFLDKLLSDYLLEEPVNTTTFRANDRADTGYRSQWLQLGFTAEEFLIEFGYPTQRFVFSGSSGQGFRPYLSKNTSPLCSVQAR